MPDELTESVLKSLAAEIRFGVSYSWAYVRGNFPHLEIIKAARRNHCDLIVRGSHGRRSISRLLLGSQTNLVLSESRTPVLVCR